VAVRLQLKSGTTVVAERTITANAQRPGMAAGLGPFHGFDLTLAAPAGTYQACATVVLWDAVAGPALPCQSVTIS
jgi:phage tail protein X